MGTTTVSTRRLSVRQGNGRISNVVAELLRTKLTVPEIYLKPRVPGLSGVDVLAVNHAGSGDVHGVEIAFHSSSLNTSEVTAWIARLKTVPLHYKYLAVPEALAESSVVFDLFRSARGFDSQGIGRLGLISYPATFLNESLPALSEDVAKLIVQPERFLLRGEKLEAVEKFLAKAHPDISVRI